MHPLAETAELDVQAIVGKHPLAGQIAASLRKTSMALFPAIRRFDDVCIAYVGATGFTGSDKVWPRMPMQITWSGSLVRANEPKMAACSRALSDAFERLATHKEGWLTESHLREMGAIYKEPVSPTFPTMKQPASSTTMRHYTLGTVNDQGVQTLGDALGDRFTTVLDHRKFGVQALLLDGKTSEGRRFCLAEVGLTAVAPDGLAVHVPPTDHSFIQVLSPGAPTTKPACSSELLATAARSLRDNYESDLQYLSLITEKGMTYPTEKALKAAVARYDAQQRAERTVANSKSKNVVRCSNQCSNGNCLRTFDNGRQERWQAPRVYNSMTQNWEWDISTNACGG